MRQADIVSRMKRRAASCILSLAIVTGSGAAHALDLEPHNTGFEEPVSSRAGPPAWSFIQHAGAPSFEMVVDDRIAQEGTHSLRIRRTGAEPYGSASQRIQADRYRGKRVRYSAWLRMDDVNAFGPGILGEISGSGLVLRVDVNGRDLFFDDMRDRPLRGTRPWTRFSIEADVPPEAVGIEFGVQLSGTGAVWFDAAQLEVVSPAPGAGATK